jgi:hypothetical protein
MVGANGKEDYQMTPQAEAIANLATIVEAANNGKLDVVQTFFSALSRKGAALDAEGIIPWDPFSESSVVSAIIARMEDQASMLRAADVYAYAINEIPAGHRKSWEAINRAVIERFGLGGFEQVKEFAWREIGDR